MPQGVLVQVQSRAPPALFRRFVKQIARGFSPGYCIDHHGKLSIEHSADVWEDLDYIQRRIRVGKEEIDDDGTIVLEVEEICGL